MKISFVISQYWCRYQVVSCIKLNFPSDFELAISSWINHCKVQPAKKALAKGQSPPQELEESRYSRPYLLVKNTLWSLLGNPFQSALAMLCYQLGDIVGSGPFCHERRQVLKVLFRNALFCDETIQVLVIENLIWMEICPDWFQYNWKSGPFTWLISSSLLVFIVW